MAMLAVLAASAFGTFSLEAAGQLPPPPPLPPLPPPPVQVPTVPLPPVPPPTLPTLPPPPAVVPPPAATPPPPPASAPAARGQAGGGSGSSGSSGSAGSSGSSGGSYGSGTGTASGQAGAPGSSFPPERPVRVIRLAPQRRWIARSGPRAQRKTSLTVVLSRPGVLVLELVRVAPDCASIGAFRVKGRAGVNRVPFRGRFRGNTLPRGTYRIRAYSRGRPVAQTRVVIFDRTPLPEEVAAARASNVCGPASGGGADAGSSGNGAAGIGSASARTGGGKAGLLRLQPGAGEGGSAPGDRAQNRPFSAGVLGARFNRATEAAKDVHPILFILLGFAIALLTLAALPLRYVPNARIAAMLAYRRSAVAVAGAMTLVTVMVFYALA